MKDAFFSQSKTFMRDTVVYWRVLNSQGQEVGVRVLDLPCEHWVIAKDFSYPPLFHV